MDAHMDSSDILNLFTDLADTKAIDCNATISLAQTTIRELVCALTRRVCGGEGREAGGGRGSGGRGRWRVDVGRELETVDLCGIKIQ